MDDELVSVVIDNGSGMCRAGFSGDDAPRAIIPNIVGHPRYPTAALPVQDPNDKYRLHGRTHGWLPDGGDGYVGIDAQQRRGILKLEYPMEHGVVTNWDYMESMWHHLLYDQLRVTPGAHPVLLSEAPGSPKAQRATMLGTLFEKFGVPAGHVRGQPMLSLYASGRASGLMLDCGDGVTHAVPIYEGYMLPHALRRWEFAGRDVTRALGGLLGERGYSFGTSAEMEVIREVKESACYVALDFEREMVDAKQPGFTEKKYELPDGHCITLGSEMFRAPEALFRPDLVGLEASGIHEMVHTSISKSDIDLRRLLFRNVILGGGSTMFPGFVARLKKELVALAPASIDVGVVDIPHRKHNVWIGGSILASLSTFKSILVTRQEYEEFGAEIVHRKCV